VPPPGPWRRKDSALESLEEGMYSVGLLGAKTEIPVENSGRRRALLATTVLKRASSRRAARKRVTARGKKTLPQLSVLGFGLLIDRDVGVGIFPEGEKILIRLVRGCLVAHHHLRAAKLKI
jgi:hypothetical protein